MRIIAGSLKGRVIQGPTGAGVRPTSDRLRETLFNVLRDRVEGARVLDGYAGTGAIGLEAISRGAAAVTFVERNRSALAVLRTNIAACGVTHVATVFAGDVGDAMRRAASDAPFELVILDPPYDVADLTEVLRDVEAVLSRQGVLVLEHARRRQAPDAVPGLVRTRLLEAGDSALSFYAPVVAG
jgi:16S rRNA (guanine966-N2)-methyltransferase